MPIWDSQNEYPEIPWIGLFLGITEFSLNFLEFSDIFLERAFGIPESHCRGKMKLICWAAVTDNRFSQETSRKPSGFVICDCVLSRLTSIRISGDPSLRIKASEVLRTRFIRNTVIDLCNVFVVLILSSFLARAHNVAFLTALNQQAGSGTQSTTIETWTLSCECFGQHLVHGESTMPSTFHDRGLVASVVPSVEVCVCVW